MIRYTPCHGSALRPAAEGEWIDFDGHAKIVANLRNELTAARLQRDQLSALIAQHNAGCKMDCEARQNCEPYTRRGRKCPDCPQDYLIELPSDLHPTADPAAVPDTK